MSIDQKFVRKIKYTIITIVSLIALFIVGDACIDRIGVGSVGVKVKLAGSSRGVQDMQLKTGWVVYNPLTEQIIEFPTKVESVVWTRDPHEGLKKGEQPNPQIDESISFSSSEGIQCSADVGFSFHIQPELAPKLYARFRQNNMQELSEHYLRNVVRDAFNEVASKLTIQQIYGAGKSQMLADVLNQCKRVMGEDGIIVDQLTLNGGLRLPQNVTDAINNAMAATQRAVESENKVRQINAEAEQAISQSKGAAESARQKAQGEADSLLIKTKAEAESRITAAESQAKANHILNSTLTPQVIQYKYLDQWNGVLPTYQGGNAAPMFMMK